MLTLYHNGRSYPINNDTYYVRELVSGLDEVLFSLSLWDPIYAMIQEEEVVYDRGGQRYLVKQIDGGSDSASIVCQLDLDAWKADLRVDYSNGSATVLQTIDAVKPAGWSVQDHAHINIRRTITGSLTPFEICEACRDVYSVYIRWDNRLKVCQILPQTMAAPLGAFATRQLNLKDIQYKGKSINFATRLYPYGKKDEEGNALTIQGATIDGAVYPYPYVENRAYADKTISAYWSDERYTIVQDLYDDAVKKLEKLAVPTRSYECSIVDLQATNPEKYGALDFSLLSTALLIDDVKEVAIQYQVVERHVYPYHPEQNEVIFDNAPVRITNTILGVVDAIENPNSDFQQILDQEITMATDWLTNNDSHVYIVPDGNGGIKEFLFLDGTQDPSTATRVMRLNSAGMGFSKTGVNGPYTNAFVFDSVLGGHLVADFITAGTLTANLIKAGRLQGVAGSTWWDMVTGELHLATEATVGSDGTTLAQINVNKTNISAEVTRATGAESGLSTRITANADGLSAEITNRTNADSALSTRITANANGLSAEITNRTNADSALSARITANANAITTKVSAGDIASTINQTAQSVLIQASKIDLSGLVTVSSLANGTTTINGGCITTGTISGDRINGGTITGSIVQGGIVSGGLFVVNDANGISQIYIGTAPSPLTGAVVWFRRFSIIDDNGNTMGGIDLDYPTYNTDAWDKNADTGANKKRIWTGHGMHISSEEGEWFYCESPARFEDDLSSFRQIHYESDERSKKDIESLTADSALNTITQLRPVTFRFKRDEKGLHHGFLAQEVQAFVKDDWDIVHDSGASLGLAYDELIADLVAAIQSLNARLAEVEAWQKTVA